MMRAVLGLLFYCHRPLSPGEARMTAPSTIREYDISAQSTSTFGRVLCSARNHHFIVDGPIQNNCPGEELTPAEVFLSGVAACGVELIHVIAREESTPLDSVSVRIHGIVDRGSQARKNVTTFNRVELDFVLTGVDPKRAGALVDGFKGRCPLFGTVSVAVPDTIVRFTVR
jgi:uncharacterized OsmC-like protein